MMETVVLKRWVGRAIHEVVWVPRRVAKGIREVRDNIYYRIRETSRGRAVLRAVEFVRSPRNTRMRQHLAQTFTARTQAPPMDPSKGYGLTAVEKFENFEAVLANARSIFEVKKAKIDRELAELPDWAEEEQQKYVMHKSKFLRNLLSDDDLRRNPTLLDFALTDAMLGMATRYLGTLPYLCRVDLVYSLPRPINGNIASQLFHVDPEGLSQVKFFIHVFDVGEPEGPFTFIPADETTRILAEIRALRRTQGKPHVGRYLDEEIEAVGGTSSIVRLQGPTGQGIAIDTSRCLHMGSRVQPGASRLCFCRQYCPTPQTSNEFDVRRFKKDPIRYLAVKHGASPSNRTRSSAQMA